jgi:ribosome biogenesis GTPase
MTVRTPQGDVLCRVRGKLRQGRAEGDLVAVGDQVLIARHDDGSGSIHQILPRKSVLSRKLSGVNYEYQQILLANPDQVVLVFACAQPDPSLRMLDRFLVVGKNRNPGIIVAINYLVRANWLVRSLRVTAHRVRLINTSTIPRYPD